MTWRLHLVGLVVAALVASARAEPAGTGTGAADASDSGDDIDDIDDDDTHPLEAAAWAAFEIALPAWYYWHTRRQQEVDWTRPSWTDKLTLHAVRFDTNPFRVNAVHHPLAGIGDYQIARSNGFGVIGSTVFAYVTGALWEFVVEYYEDPAINDLIINGASGLAIGEPLYQVGQLWRGGEMSPSDRMRTATFSPFCATQDLWRTHRPWPRRRAWSDFAFTAGAENHRLDDGTY